MRIVLAIALAISLTAAAAIAPTDLLRSPATAAWSVGPVIGASSGVSRASTAVSARKWKQARKQPRTKVAMSRRRASAPTRRHRAPALERSETNLPPNLGIGIGGM